jgi:chromosome segregation ATPase
MTATRSENVDCLIDSLRAQLSAKENESDELLAELTTLSESFERSQKEEDDARADAEELRMLNTILESQCNDISDELQTTKREMEEARDEVRMLEASLWYAKEETQVARVEAERATCEAIRAQEEIGYLRRVLSADTDIDRLLEILQVSIELDRGRSGARMELEY